MNLEQVLDEAYRILEEVSFNPRVLKCIDTLSGVRCGEDHDQPALKEWIDGPGFFQTLKKALSHRRATPKNKEIFKKEYVWANTSEEGANTTNRNIVNYSEEDAEKFLDRLISGAISAYKKKENNDNKTSRRDRFFLMLGDRGVGKTFFINYLFSVYSEKLINKKTIWIRISLVSRRKGWNVSERLYRKSVRIIFEKYLNRDEFLGDIEGLREYLINTKKKGKQEALDIAGAVEKIDDSWSVTNKVDKSVFICVYDYMTSLGYNFLFAVDGLDAIRETDKHKQDLENWIDEVLAFIIRDEFPACWVVMMRGWTYQEHIRPNYSPAEGRQYFTEVYINQPDPYIVVARRFKYMSYLSDEKIADIIAFNMHRLLVLILSDALNCETVKSFDNMLGLYGNDIRRLLSTIYYCVFELISEILPSKNAFKKYDAQEEFWLEEEGLNKALNALELGNFEAKTFRKPEVWKEFYKKRSYAIVDRMVLGGYLWHVSPFFFSIDDQGDLAIDVNQDHTDKAGAMPNLYTYPVRLGIEYNLQHNILRFGKLMILSFLEESELGGCNPWKNIFQARKVFAELGVPGIAFDCFLHELVHYGAVEKKLEGSDPQIKISASGVFCLTGLASNKHYIESIYNSCELPRRLFCKDYLRVYIHNKTKSENRHAISARNLLIFMRFLEISWQEAKQEILKKEGGYADEYKDDITGNIDLIINALKTDISERMEKQVRAAFTEEDQILFKSALLREFVRI